MHRGAVPRSLRVCPVLGCAGPLALDRLFHVSSQRRRHRQPHSRFPGSQPGGRLPGHFPFSSVYRRNRAGYSPLGRRTLPYVRCRDRQRAVPIQRRCVQNRIIHSAPHPRFYGGDRFRVGLRSRVLDRLLEFVFVG